MGGLVDRVTNDEDWSGPKPDSHLNVAVACAGLRALGVPEAITSTFSAEFCEGMAARNRLLGDLGASDPKQWDSGLGSGAAHVLVIINARTTAHIEDELRRRSRGSRRSSGPVVECR